jgi:hypothetical protein
VTDDPNKQQNPAKILRGRLDQVRARHDTGGRTAGMYKAIRAMEEKIDRTRVEADVNIIATYRYLGMFKTFGPDVAAALEGTKLVEPDQVYEGTAVQTSRPCRECRLASAGR